MIRRIDEADWEQLRDIRLRALATDPAAFLDRHDDVRERPEAHWRARARVTETSVTFVDERGDVFEAMVASFVADDPSTAYLVGMWVAPDQRGTGVADDLVRHVLEWARDHGRHRVVLSVEAGNDRAARVYERCGFVEIPQPAKLPYEPNPDNRFFAYEL